jgi:hypothetical protein
MRKLLLLVPVLLAGCASTQPDGDRFDVIDHKCHGGRLAEITVYLVNKDPDPYVGTIHIGPNVCAERI